MSSNFNLSFLDPALQKILSRLENVKPNDGEGLSEGEINEIVEDIIESEGGDKLNMGSKLTAYEKGFYLSEGKLGAVSDDYFVRGASVAMKNQLAKLGVLQLDSKGNVTSFNKEKAKQIFGIEVSSWQDLVNLNDGSGKFWDIAYSVEDLEGIPSILLSKYFIGPALIASTEENYNSSEFEFFYAMNLQAIAKDYPNVKTLDDLKEAINTDYENTHNVNGEIDEWVSQGGTGDCWLLSGVLALASTDEGKKAIRDAIQVNSDGSVTVTFKGAFDKNGAPIKITIPADEIRAHDTDTASSDALSNGDNDMLVLELAVSKLEEMLRYGDATISNSVSSAMVPDYQVYDDGYVAFIEGSLASRLIGMLTGAESDIHYNDLTRGNIYDILSNAAENPDTVLTFGLYNGEHNGAQTNGEQYSISISGGHAFAITNVTQVKNQETGKIDPKKSTVTFVNPWDSTDKITMSWEEFVNLDIGQMSTTSLNGNAGGVEKDAQYQLDWAMENFISGNLTENELVEKLKEIGINNVNISLDGVNTIVKFTDLDGDECTLICNTQAVNDGVRGANGEDVQLFVTGSTSNVIGVSGSSGYLAHYATFTNEEIAQYFVPAASYIHDGEEKNVGYYIPNGNWPEGVSTPEELRAYLDNNGGTRASKGKSPDFGAIRNLDHKSYSSYDKFEADILDAFGDYDFNMYMLPQTDGSYMIYIEYEPFDDDPSVDSGYLTMTVKITDENKVQFMKLGGVESEFSDIINVVDEGSAVKALQALEQVKSGDVNALLDLEDLGFDISDAVLNENGTYDVTVSIEGVSYTFNFSTDKEADLINLGYLEKPVDEPDNIDEPDDVVEPNNVEKPADSNGQTEFTAGELKHKYNLTPYDIKAFFKQQGDKFVINQHEMKMIFGREDINTIEDLFDAIENNNYKSYSHAVSGFSQDELAKFFTPINKFLTTSYTTGYALNFDAIKEAFPGKNITTVGQLYEALHSDKSAQTKDGINETKTEFTMEELQKEYNLTTNDIWNFFRPENGKMVLNQNEIRRCFGEDVEINTVADLMNAIENKSMSREFLEGSWQGGYHLSNDVIYKYFIQDENGNYILNQEVLDNEFPDKITTVGQLQLALLRQEKTR